MSSSRSAVSGRDAGVAADGLPRNEAETVLVARGADRGLLTVVGGESTGKSTLAQALADELPGLLVPEVLRGWVAEMGRVPRPDEQRDVMLAQADAETRALTAGDPRLGGPKGDPSAARATWVVSDGGVLMTAVYSTLYYRDDSLLLEAVRLAQRSALVVWCDDDIPWVADEGQRDGPDLRAAAQRIIGEVLRSGSLPWIRVSGDVPSRVAAVTDALATMR